MSETSPYMPEKIDLNGTSPRDERIAELRQLFPEAFADGKIDFDALRLALGDAVETAPREERFGLRWPGKSKLQQIINQPSVGTLVPQPEESVDWDTTQNMIIEGDNLEVLKLLQKSYAGKVKMIYIDPPYNTGNDFVYPDNFSVGLDAYLMYSGQRNEAGQPVDSNPDAAGRFHSNWLNMMLPRLFLARNLLRDDGVIVVSIDDHELSNLRRIMDEVFGEENFVAVLVWESRTSISNDQIFSSNHDYQIVFARDIDHAEIIGDPLDPTEYSNPDNDPRGPWKPVPLDANKPGGDTKFPIVNPNTGEEFYPPSTRSWAINQSTYQQLWNDKRISFGSTGLGAPKRKLFLYEREARGDSKTPSTLLRDAGTTTQGTSELDTLFGQRVFQYPKPTTLLLKLIRYGASLKDGLVLDFFAGSGTTAHAVLASNVAQADLGFSQRFILVQLPEPLDETKTLNNGTRLNTIADITRERVRRAGKKIRKEHAEAIAQRETPLDTGFRAYKLASSNFTPWNGEIPAGDIVRQLDLLADHILPEATDDSLLAELMLKLGIDLTAPVSTETIAGKKVFNILDGAVLACFDRAISLDLIEALAAREPAEIICLDAGFPDDRTKVNAGQIIASHARHAEASIAFKVI